MSEEPKLYPTLHGRGWTSNIPDFEAIWEAAYGADIQRASDEMWEKIKKDTPKLKIILSTPKCPEPNPWFEMWATNKKEDERE